MVNTRITGTLHEPPGEGTGPTGCRPGPLTRRLEWFMVPMHAQKRNGATHQRPFSGAGVPPATGASRPRIRRGRDARDGSRDGCPTTARGEFMVLGAAFAGFLSIELAVAMAILAATLIPMSYAFLHERQLSRACYYRAVAMEIVDGEIELLRAGEWRAFAEGSNSYSTRAESARNLPPGRFVLTREGKRLRLEWLPEKRKKGGRVSREVTLP